jgi:hypothetical protein
MVLCAMPLVRTRQKERNPGRIIMKMGERCLRVVGATVLAICGTLAAGCGGGGGGESQTPASTYSISGSIAGLSGADVKLDAGAAGTVDVSANGSFSFPKPIQSGTSYNVQVAAQPGNPAQTCTVTNGTGTVAGTNVTTVSVTCTTNSYSVIGTVAGLIGSGLVIQNNGSDDLTVSSNGSFTFSSQVKSGDQYSVSVVTQASSPSQNCVVSAGTGTVGSSDVTSVSVNCATNIAMDNADSVAQVGNSTAETLLQLASFAGERMTYLAAHLGSSTAEQCSSPLRPHPGTATYQFADNDQSRTVSAGDVVTITLNGCESPSLADFVTGTVVLTIKAPPLPANYTIGFSADADFSALPLLGLQLGGKLTVTYTDVDEKQFVQAQVNSPGLTMTYSGTSGFYPADNITIASASVSKTIDYVLPGYAVNLTSDYRSARLKGEFSLTTSSPLTGHLDIYPVSGVEEFRGGAGVLRYSAQDVSDNASPAAILDSDSSGTFVPISASVYWNANFDGFPWWQPRGLGRFVGMDSRPAYQTSTRDLWVMGLVVASPLADPVNEVIGDNIDVRTTIKLFFTAPFDASRTSFIFQPQLSGQPGLPPNVNGTVQVNGAIVTLNSQTQLEHGFQYQLVSQDGYVYTTTPNPNGIDHRGFPSLRFTTDNRLQADAVPSPGVASPGQTVSLKSARSFSTNSTIVSYAWQQVSGTHVTLAGANTATATFSVPAQANNGEALVFSLIVTDATGETDSVQTTAFVLTDLSQPFLYYRQGQGSAYGLTPEDATLETSATGSILTELDMSLNIFRFIVSSSSAGDELQIMAPYGYTLAPGPVSSVNFAPSLPVPIIVTRQPFQCYTPTWQYTILDSVAAADGSAQKFAADFSEQCPDGKPPFQGSVRINSTVPLP